MTSAEAHALLSAAKAGADYPAHIIDQALMATGDLDATERRVIWCDAATAPPLPVPRQAWHPGLTGAGVAA